MAPMSVTPYPLPLTSFQWAVAIGNEVADAGRAAPTTVVEFFQYRLVGNELSMTLLRASTELYCGSSGSME